MADILMYYNSSADLVDEERHGVIAYKKFGSTERYFCRFLNKKRNLYNPKDFIYSMVTPKTEFKEVHKSVFDNMMKYFKSGDRLYFDLAKRAVIDSGGGQVVG